MKRGRPSKLDTDPAYVAALGTAPDQVVADLFGVNKYTVQRHRMSLGISAKRGARKAYIKRPCRAPVGLLGRIPDADLAAQCGLSRQRIEQLRKERNIPRCPAPRPATAAIRLATVHGWDDPMVTTAEIARRSGYTCATVRRYRQTAKRPLAVQQVIALMTNGEVSTVTLAAKWEPAHGSRSLAAIRCSRMVTRGWIRRIRRGVYGLPKVTE